MIFDGYVNQLPDTDPAETQEWLDSLDAVVDVHGKTRARFLLSKLLERAEAGEEVIIARAGRPVAKLVRIKKAGGRRRLGLLDGKFRIPDDFNAPLPESVLRAFERKK